MVDKLDLGLDDIIKINRTANKQRRGSGQRNRLGMRGGRFQRGRRSRQFQRGRFFPTDGRRRGQRSGYIGWVRPV